MIAKLKMYRRGLSVERLHTVPHHQPYNNGSHSANAALIAYELCQLNALESADVVLYMLKHDLAEQRTGDIPADAKVDAPAIKVAVDQLERDWEKANGVYHSNLNAKGKAIAKIADLAELGMYCLSEMAMGNTGVSHVLDNVVDYLFKFRDKYTGVNELVQHFINEGRAS